MSGSLDTDVQAVSVRFCLMSDGEGAGSRKTGRVCQHSLAHHCLSWALCGRIDAEDLVKGVDTAKIDAVMKKALLSQGDLFSVSEEKTLPSVAPDLWKKLARSAFRRKFHLNAADLSYLQEKTLPVVLEHGADFIAKRLAPARPARDGKQTPWKGHPVFVAQHATGTCCRSCLEKWHHFSKGLHLTSEQQRYVLAVLAGWLEHELIRAGGDLSEQESITDRQGIGGE